MRRSALSLKVSCKRDPDFFSFCMSHKPRTTKTHVQIGVRACLYTCIYPHTHTDVRVASGHVYRQASIRIYTYVCVLDMFPDRHVCIYKHTYTYIYIPYTYPDPYTNKMHLRLSLILQKKQPSSIEIKCRGQRLPRVSGLERNQRCVMKRHDSKPTAVDQTCVPKIPVRKTKAVHVRVLEGGAFGGD